MTIYGRFTTRIGPALLVLFLAAILGCFSGCQQAANNAGAKRIGVTLLTRDHEFYRQLEAGLKEAADKQGYQLIITSGDSDLAKQQSQIENFIVQRVDAIIVCPADSKGIGPAIQRANQAKIPVFTADIAAQAEDMLQGTPGLKAIFGINDDSALGALSAAEARGRNDLVIVGYDATPPAVA